MQFKDFSKPLQIRIMLRFISVITNSAVMPFIVLFFANEIGSVKVTLLTLLMGGVGVVGTIVGGSLTDSVGRKIPILIGESFTAVGIIFLIIGQYTPEYMISLSIIAFMMTNFFAGFSLPAYSAFILDETTKETRKVIYVFMMWTGYLGLAIGSVIGGLLFADYKITLFILIVVTSILNVLIIALFIPETIQKARNEIPQLEEDSTNTSESKESLLSIVIKNKVLLILLFMGFIFQFMDNQISYYLSLYFYDIFEESSYELLGFLRTENTIIAIIFLYAIKKYMTRFQEMNIALVGASFLFAGYILLSALQMEILLYGAMFIASVGEILLFPALQGISANQIPPLFRGRYTGLATNCGTAGAILAAMFLALNALQIPLIVTSIYTIMGFLTVGALIRLKWILNGKHVAKFRGWVAKN
jgi:MFS transporter, DHA1 family, multidrug resistance protein B